MIETIATIYLIIGFIIAIGASGGNLTTGILFRSIFLWLPITVNAFVWEIVGQWKRRRRG